MNKGSLTKNKDIEKELKAKYPEWPRRLLKDIEEGQALPRRKVLDVILFNCYAGEGVRQELSDAYTSCMGAFYMAKKPCKKGKGHCIKFTGEQFDFFTVDYCRSLGYKGKNDYVAQLILKEKASSENEAHAQNNSNTGATK